MLPHFVLPMSEKYSYECGCVGWEQNLATAHTKVMFTCSVPPEVWERRTWTVTNAVAGFSNAARFSNSTHWRCRLAQYTENRTQFSTFHHCIYPFPSWWGQQAWWALSQLKDEDTKQQEFQTELCLVPWVVEFFESRGISCMVEVSARVVQSNW